MSAKNRFRPLILEGFDAPNLTANYQVINEDGFEFPISILRITNRADVDVYISFDGVHDHEYLISDTVMQLDGQANASPSSFVAMFPKGQKIYVKQFNAPGNGSILVTGYGMVSE